MCLEDVPGLVVCRRFGHSAAWNTMRCIGMFAVVPGMVLHGLQGWVMLRVDSGC